MMDNVVALHPEVSDFDRFWAVCPKKVDKAIARAKFEKIVSPEGLRTKILDRDSGDYVTIHLHATPQELIDGMKRYCRTQCPQSTWDEIAKGKAVLPDGGRFTVQPATWLNRGRWMD